MNKKKQIIINFFLIAGVAIAILLILNVNKTEKYDQCQIIEGDEVTEGYSGNYIRTQTYSGVQFDVRIVGVEAIYELYFVPGNDSCSYCIVECQNGTLSNKKVDKFAPVYYEEPTFNKSSVEGAIDTINVKYYDINDQLQMTQNVTILWNNADNVCVAVYY